MNRGLEDGDDASEVIAVDGLVDERQKKLKQIERKKAELQASLEANDFTTLVVRVAHILNLYPDTRNSDVTLTLQYWETYQADLYSPLGIKPKDLFKLERSTIITRARAKIQNEYGLFQAEEGIKRKRRKLEERIEAGVIEAADPRTKINVFADETGKTGKFLLIGAVWVLVGRAVYSVTKAILDWQKTSPWAKREIHFKDLRGHDVGILQQYLEVILANREYLSFKIIAMEQARTKRSVVEIVDKLHELMLIRGAEHEIATGRVKLPRDIDVTLDEEQSLDAISLSHLKDRVAEAYRRNHEGGIAITSIKSVSSEKNVLIQLADLVAGAVGRRLNHEGPRGVKDDMADIVIKMLDLELAEAEFPGLDSSAIFIL